MHLTIPKRRYIESLKPLSNQPLSLKVLMSPFLLDLPKHEQLDECFLIGHLLDYLDGSFEEGVCLDPMDIASQAFELGCDFAEDFLDHGPALIMSKLSAKNSKDNF